MENLLAKLNHRLTAKNTLKVETKSQCNKIEIMEGVHSFRGNHKREDIASWGSPIQKDPYDSWECLLGGKKQKKNFKSSTYCREEIRKLFPLRIEPILTTPPKNHQNLIEKPKNSSLKKSEKGEINKDSIKIDHDNLNNDSKKIQSSENIKDNENDNTEDTTFEEIIGNLNRIKQVANEMSHYIPVYESKTHFKENIDYSNNFIKKEVESFRKNLLNQTIQNSISAQNSNSKITETIIISDSQQPFKAYQNDINREIKSYSIYEDSEIPDLQKQKGFSHKLKSNLIAFKLNDREIFNKSSSDLDKSYYSDMNNNYLEMQKIKLEETEKALRKQRIM